MIHLSISTPDKRKVLLECPATMTFAEVKQQIEAETSVPPDKQRLLCNGKERKDDKETLAAAGVGAKSKLMLMLVPGYAMPPPPAQSTQGEAQAAGAAAGAAAAAGTEIADEGSQEPVILEGVLGGPQDVADEAIAGSVLVRQGQNRYRIRLTKGLHEVTFGDIADYLAAQMLPPGIPPSELRLISKGKTASREDVLDKSGSNKEFSILLLFREGFHLAEEGTRWMREQAEELTQAEAKITSLAKRVEANFCDAETSLQLAEVAGRVETFLQSVESVRVNATKLPAMEELRDRARKANDRLQALRKAVRF
ncbi:unnamed protein product [Symbiodinium sp. KB8]|nr:unnamed protein product [Symbiodinium sp. KB8]